MILTELSFLSSHLKGILINGLGTGSTNNFNQERFFEFTCFIKDISLIHSL